MGYIGDKILALSKQLYPTGRAWKMAFGGGLENLHVALAISEEQAWNDATAILYSILPDNANFTVDDATDWERRLGMVASTAPLADRMAAIKRKLNAPGLNPAKQNWMYVQEQLQMAGFNVWVYENIFDPYPYGDPFTQTPLDVTDGSYPLTVENQHGDFQHGQLPHGVTYTNKVANHIDEKRDLMFSLAPNMRSTFFIGGNPLGSFADVPLVRKDEFRQLILTLKPVQTVGLLFVNYV